MHNNSNFTISLFEDYQQAPISKEISLDKYGKVQKKSLGQLSDGKVSKKSFGDLKSFGRFMTNLPPYQAISLGVCDFEEVRVLSRRKADTHKGSEITVTRTKDNFKWSEEPGVMLLDYDPPSNKKPLPPEELINTIRTHIPGLEDIQMFSKPSASSCIYDEDGNEIRGISGQHVFFICSDASDIPAIGKIISDRLWLIGEGYISLSKSGHMLERTIVDTTVWSPERLVFSSAHCVSGITQKFPEPYFCNGKLKTISLSEVLPLTDKENQFLAKVKFHAKEQKLGEAAKTKEIWLLNRAKETVNREIKNKQANNGDTTPLDSALVKEMVQKKKEEFSKVNIEGYVLPPDLILYPHKGSPIIARELLLNKDKWHNKYFRDPFEPDYHNNTQVAFTILKDCAEPYIYSHAHGGINYSFCSEEDRNEQYSKEMQEVLPQPPNNNERFKIIDGEEFMNRPEPEWVVDNIFPESGIAMVFGASTAGKTFFILDLILSIALGKNWRDRKTKKGNVVYIAAEGSGGVIKRLKAYSHHFQVSLKKILGVIDESPNLLKNDHKELIQAIKKHGNVKVVVVDTLAQTTPGANENAGEDMGLALDRCKAIYQETGALVILIHHSGKNREAGPRGWSGMTGAMDTIIEVTQKNEKRTAKIIKQKDGESGASFHFNLAPVIYGFDKKDKELVSCVVEHLDEAAITSKKEPGGKWQKLILSKVEKHIFDSDKITKDLIISEIMLEENLERKDPLLQRKDPLLRSMKKLIEDECIIEEGGYLITPQAPQKTTNI